MGPFLVARESIPSSIAELLLAKHDAHDKALLELVSNPAGKDWFASMPEQAQALQGHMPLFLALESSPADVRVTTCILTFFMRA